MSDANETIKKLGLQLPAIEAPAGSYLNYTQSGSLLFVSGQTPLAGWGVKHKGKLGLDLSIEEGQAAARNCGLQLIAILQEACQGDLNRVKQIVKINAMINAAPNFEEHPQITNGCSQLMEQVFGEAGRHARLSVGVSSLPEQAPVEIELTAELAD